MQDRVLLLAALISSIVGIFALILLAALVQPPQLAISELEANIGKVVVVEAVVDKISYKEDAVFMTLSDSTGKILTVFFGDPATEIISGDKVAIKGKVQLYRGDLEIIIQELQCLSC